MGTTVSSQLVSDFFNFFFFNKKKNSINCKHMNKKHFK